jgi:hypothetical protein
MKTRIVLLVIVGMFAAAPAAAAASCPQPESVVAALEEAPTAFVGRVTATSDFDRIAEMRVVAVWKGDDLEEQITVRGVPVAGAPVAATDGRFTVGSTYLVIPDNTRQPFLASSCSATQAYAANGLIIPPAYRNAVGATQGRAPLVNQPGAAAPTDDVPGGLVFGLAAAGLTVSGVSLAANRRRSAARTAMGERLAEPSTAPQPKFRRRHLSTTGLLPRLFRRSGMRRTDRNRKKR